MIGRVVGSYKMLDKLGEGGMGTVYRAIDLMLEREVAIKVLHHELIHRSNVVKRFRAEAVTLARINHPHVALLYNFLREGDDFFMVMEFVHGEPLDEIIQREGALPLEQALRLFGQALDGIAYAHHLGIIHRDVKPSNMMVTVNGEIKVMDFGIARVLGSARMTKTGHLIGTIEYMSPEQIRGRDVDERSDIYSLGILLYEMLTGRVPFESGSDYELMRAQIERPPPPPRTLAPHVPEAVERAVLRALEKDPAARFPSATAFHDALDRTLGARLTPTVVALPDTMPPPTRMAEAAQVADAPAVRATRLAEEQEAEWPTVPAAAPRSTRRAGAEEAAVMKAAKATRLAQEPPPPAPMPSAPSLTDRLVAAVRLDRLGPKHYAGLAALALVLILLPLAVWLSSAPSSTEPALDAPTTQQSDPAPGAANTESNPQTPARPADPTGQQDTPLPEQPVIPPAQEAPDLTGLEKHLDVPKWLAQARRYFEANQLTSPAGENALELCERVLAVDAGNREALHLLGQIVQRYAGWGDAQRDRGAYQRALEHYRKGLDIARRHPGALGALAADVSRKIADMEARAAAPTGDLRIVVRPFGDIYVDGQRKAKATNRTHTESVPAGAYRVRAVHPFFGSWEKQVSVRAGAAQEVLFNFNAEYKLTVTSTPPNAEILVDGEPTGRYTPSMVTVHPGQRAVSVRRRGYETATARRLTVESTLKEPIHFVLKERSFLNR